MRLRAGSALIELVTSLALLGILAAACVSLLRSQTLLLRNTADRAATAEALRTAAGVLHAELQDLAAADISIVDRDSVAGRVLRGFGIVCAYENDRVMVRYRGLREPEPEKDSILIVGTERTRPFRMAAGDVPCSARAGERPVALHIAEPPGIGAVLLFFERGAYHIANGALRYRRAAEGRQPLTEELIDHRRSRFAPEGAGIRILLHGGAADSTVSYVRFTNPR